MNATRNLNTSECLNVWFTAGRGHYAAMDKTDTRGGNSARLVSPYINTTGKCLELFYWIRGELLDDDFTHLKVIAITEEHKERFLQVVFDLTAHFPRLFLRLPDGTHRIAIEGKRSPAVFCALSLDDVTIMDCDRFGKMTNADVIPQLRVSSLLVVLFTCPLSRSFLAN